MNYRDKLILISSGVILVAVVAEIFIFNKIKNIQRVESASNIYNISQLKLSRKEKLRIRKAMKALKEANIKIIDEIQEKRLYS